MCMYILFHNKISKKMREGSKQVHVWKQLLIPSCHLQILHISWTQRSTSNNLFFFFNKRWGKTSSRRFILVYVQQKQNIWNIDPFGWNVISDLMYHVPHSSHAEENRKTTDNIRPIYANWFYEISFTSTSLIISSWWSSLAIKRIHRPNFCVSHRRNKMSFFRN